MAHKRHSSDFKREAVKLALTSGLPREAVAADLGIGKSTLGKWIKPSIGGTRKTPVSPWEVLRACSESLPGSPPREQDPA